MSNTTMRELLEQALRSQAFYLEAMAAAFVKTTGLSPEECELVQESKPDGKLIWYFRKRVIPKAVEQPGLSSTTMDSTTYDKSP